MSTDKWYRIVVVGLFGILLSTSVYADNSDKQYEKDRWIEKYYRSYDYLGSGYWQKQYDRLQRRFYRLKNKYHKLNNQSVQLGPRPFFLVDDMDESPLKQKLQSCKNGPFYTSTFSIGHRGAPMQFPEHTKESYVAAAKMGAGILECDVTFTKDRELVCRHAQYDLHTTTDILATSLAQKCSVAPEFSAEVKLVNAADIKCCTSDITLAEFKTLQGKMDAANINATSIEEYINATVN